MSEPGQLAPGRTAKGAGAFRTIGEVASDLDLPAHVLRFWESKFPQLKPLKRGGGRRYYRPEDILLLRRIRQCLYQDGYTIRGLQKLLEGAPARRAQAGNGPDAAGIFPQPAAPDPAAPPLLPLGPPPRPPRRRPGMPRPRDPAGRAELEAIRRELLEARALLDELLRRPKAPPPG